jgi:hypothetical protein
LLLFFSVLRPRASRKVAKQTKENFYIKTPTFYEFSFNRIMIAKVWVRVRVSQYFIFYTLFGISFVDK